MRLPLGVDVASAETLAVAETELVALNVLVKDCVAALLLETELVKLRVFV